MVEALIAADGRLDMESGLIRLVVTLLIRMRDHQGVGIDVLADYVLNNAAAWTFPSSQLDCRAARYSGKTLEGVYDHVGYRALSLVGEEDIPADQVAAKLDEDQIRHFGNVGSLL